MFITKITKEDIHMIIANQIGVAYLDSTLLFSDDFIGIEYDREFGSSNMMVKEEYILTPNELIDLILEELQHHYDAAINSSNVRFSWKEDETPDDYVLKMTRNFK